MPRCAGEMTVSGHDGAEDRISIPQVKVEGVSEVVQSDRQLKHLQSGSLWAVVEVQKISSLLRLRREFETLDVNSARRDDCNGAFDL